MKKINRWNIWRANRWYRKCWARMLKIAYEFPAVPNELMDWYQGKREGEILAETRRRYNLPDDWRPKQ